MVDIAEVNKPMMILPHLVYLHPGSSRVHLSEGRLNDGCLDTCGKAIIARSVATRHHYSCRRARIRRSSLWLCSAI